jgi:hypothetical protein
VQHDQDKDAKTHVRKVSISPHFDREDSGMMDWTSGLAVFDSGGVVTKTFCDALQNVLDEAAQCEPRSTTAAAKGSQPDELAHSEVNCLLFFKKKKKIANIQNQGVDMFLCICIWQRVLPSFFPPC